MDFSEIFEQYYNLYRLEAETPATSDDEWPIAVRLANEAINRWKGYDATYWQELFTTMRLSGESMTIDANTTEYDCPDDMKEVGGYAKVIDSNNVVQAKFAIISPQDAQFKGDSTPYVFFTGDPNNGFTMNLNPIPSTSIIGMTVDFVYYKKPTLMTIAGTETPEMNDPYFMVHRMLANRFRGSRNPYYGSAKTDAEDILKTMKMHNDSGDWANPWKLADNSGAQFGGSFGDW